MLSLTTARRLRDAGLSWTPAELDFFAVPYPGLENQLFAINNLTVMVETIGDELAITFHGSVEWALDHVWAGEAVWVPSEEQLRELLEEYLIGETQPALVLSTTRMGYRCDIQFHGRPINFEDFEASEAYASALLHIIEAEHANAQH